MAIKQKPEWFSAAQFRKDPVAYVSSLNKGESIALAKYLDYRYHEKSKPVVADEAYDILIDHISSTWPSSSYLKKVGHKVSKGRKKVRLPVPMASLNKMKPDSKNLEKFLAHSGFVISDKLDGISLELQYVDGKPVGAYTRGDGVVGQDVSGVISALRIPKSIPEKGTVEVRCEFIIKRKSFADKHSKTEGKGDFATGRNMGGGLLNRNEPSKAVTDFDVVAYEIVGGRKAGTALSAQLSHLKQWGFDVVRYRRVSGLTSDALTEMHDKFRKTAQYEIDGIVVAQDKAYRVSKDNPKHAIAFKINSLAASQVVEIKDIEWNRSRHGRLVPRIIVDPITLGGVTVQHFTGHNYYFIKNGFSYKDKKKKLPVRPINIGAQVRVIRSGDVIPYVMEVIKPSRKASEPDVAYELDATGVNAIATREKGKVDPELRKMRIVHFFSSMEVEGLREGTVEKLYAVGFKTVKKIIDADVSDLLRAEGIQERSARTIVDNIRKGLTDPTFARTAYASGVFGNNIGKSKLQAIVEQYPNIMSMATRLSVGELQAKLEDVAGIKTQAAIIAKRLPKFVAFLEKNDLKLVGEKKAVKASNKLAGVKVLFTSVRDQALLDAILTNGGAKASSVKSATHLIVKPGASNNKTAAAQELGIPVMTVDEFKRQFKL